MDFIFDPIKTRTKISLLKGFIFVLLDQSDKSIHMSQSIRLPWSNVNKSNKKIANLFDQSDTSIYM